MPNGYFVRLRNGRVDDSFLPLGGANGPVNVIKKYADDNYLIAGEFTQFNGKNHSKLVRLKSNGSVDDAFNIGASAAGNIHDLAIDFKGRILAVGDFSSFNGDLYSNIVRINPDGTTDNSFKLGASVDEGTSTLIAGYLDDVVPTTVLILTAEKIDARLKVIKRIKKVGVHLSFASLKARDAVSWLVAEAQGQLNQRVSLACVDPGNSECLR